MLAWVAISQRCVNKENDGESFIPNEEDNSDVEEDNIGKDNKNEDNKIDDEAKLATPAPEALPCTNVSPDVMTRQYLPPKNTPLFN